MIVSFGEEKAMLFFDILWKKSLIAHLETFKLSAVKVVMLLMAWSMSPDEWGDCKPLMTSLIYDKDKDHSSKSNVELTIGIGFLVGSKSKRKIIMRKISIVNNLTFCKTIIFFWNSRFFRTFHAAHYFINFLCLLASGFTWNFFAILNSASVKEQDVELMIMFD